MLFLPSLNINLNLKNKKEELIEMPIIEFFIRGRFCANQRGLLSAL